MSEKLSNERDRQREETRRRLYTAALLVFRRDGVETCRIDDIAREAKVSRGAFYFHYPTKDEVLKELLAEAEAEVARGLSLLPEGAPLPAALSAVGAAMARSWRDDPALLAAAGAVALKLAAAGEPPSFVRAALLPRF